jgi:hypothetical protein
MQTFTNILFNFLSRTIPRAAICLTLLKIEFLLNNIYKSSSYLTGNTSRNRYKAQPVNAVWGKSRCLL